ncbi:hypothetical protein Tco_1103344 [Tanacetum coccineum]
MSENEDIYHDTVLDLKAKLKKNVDLILKLGNSLQGMFMLGPKPLSVYDQQLKHGNSEISLNVRDTEDTLDDASKSQQKVYEKMNDPIAVANKQNCWTIDYAQINALYKDFVPQKELSAEQKYFPSSFIPSDKNSNATPSIPASMPSESPLIIELDKIKNCFQRLSELIQKNCKRASIFYTSPEEIQLNDFCQDQLKPIVNELQFYFELFNTLFQRDIKEMKDVFESTESELCELEKQNDFLKDQLLEVSLKHEVELSVLLNHECVDNSLHAEIEQLKKKSIEIQEGLQARIKILEKDVQRCEKQSVDFELKLQHEKEKHKWDSSFKNKNTNPLDYSWISKMEKLEDENVSLDFTVQSLIKERDNVKLEYQKLFNSIKKTRSQTQTEMDELIAHVSEKTYAYGAIRAENQNLLFTISELKTRLANVEKGMYVTSSVTRPKSRDSHVKASVLDVSKNEAKKQAVYVRKNKQTDNTFAKEFVSNKRMIPKSSVAPKTRFCEKATQSETLDTTSVASKSKIDEASASKARDKVVQHSMVVDMVVQQHMTDTQEDPPVVTTTSDEQTSPISYKSLMKFIKKNQLILMPVNQELLKKHGLDECVSMSTPMATKRLDADLQGTPTDQTTYHRMIGGLMYLTASRPDIAFATFVCARYQARPTVKHLKEVKRIFRYLRQSYNMGLWYPKDSGFELIAYSDADHAGCKDDCKSTSGGLQFLGGKLSNILRQSTLTSVIIMAQQHAADVHPDELCPPNKRYDLMDANKKVYHRHGNDHHRARLDEILLRNIRKIQHLALQQLLPWIYMAQFWHTLKEDGSKHRLKFLLDRKELTLTLDDFRIIFHLPQANDNNHASVSLADVMQDILQVIVYTRYGMGPTAVADNANHGNHREMKLTEHYKMYAEVFGLDVPLTQSQPTESTQGTYRTPSAPRSPNSATETAEVNWYIQHLAAEEIKKLVEDLENVDDSSPPRHDDTSIPGTRLEPRSDKEKSEKNVEETRISPIPSPTRSPRNLSTLASSDTEKLQELTVTQPTHPSGSSAPKRRYGYLFAQTQEKVHAMDSKDHLADNFNDVMMETLPSLVKEKVTEQAHISSQIQNAIDNAIPSLVDASIRSYMSGHILHVHSARHKFNHPLFRTTIQLYLLSKGCSSITTTNIANLKTSEYEAYVSGESLSGQVNVEEPCPSTLARYGVENWKNPHGKIFYIRRQKEPGREKEEIYSNSKIVQVIMTYWELGHEHKFIIEIVVRRANDCIVSITEPDYKNLNKNNIEDMYLLIVNNKVPDYANTGLLWSLSVFIRSSVIWERVHDFQLGIESYQQKINLTAPTISLCYGMGPTAIADNANVILLCQ